METYIIHSSQLDGKTVRERTDFLDSRKQKNDQVILVSSNKDELKNKLQDYPNVKIFISKSLEPKDIAKIYRHNSIPANQEVYILPHKKYNKLFSDTEFKDAYPHVEILTELPLARIEGIRRSTKAEVTGPTTPNIYKYGTYKYKTLSLNNLNGRVSQNRYSLHSDVNLTAYQIAQLKKFTFLYMPDASFLEIIKSYAFLAAVLSAISVVTIPLYGGTFVADVIKKLAALYDIPVTEKLVDQLRTFFAIDPTVVNQNINYLTILAALTKIHNAVSKIHCSKSVKDKILLSIKLIGEVVIAQVAATPVFMTGYEGLKDKWGKEGALIMAGFQQQVGVTTNVYSLDKAEKLVDQKIRKTFYSDKAKVAKVFRYAIIHRLNASLDPQHQLSPYALKILSSGSLYYPSNYGDHIKKTFIVLAVLLPLAYIFGAFFESTYKGFEDFEKQDEFTKQTREFFRFCKYIIPTPASAFRYFFLALTTYMSLNDIYNRHRMPILADTGIDQPSYRWTKVIAGDVALSVFTVLSLTNAEGILNAFLTKKIIWDILVALMGGAGANYTGLKTVLTKLFQFFSIKATRAWQSMPFVKEKDLVGKKIYGETKSVNIKRNIENVTLLSDEEIFDKYCMVIKNNDEEKAPLTSKQVYFTKDDGTTYALSLAAEELLNAASVIKDIDDKVYAQFVKTDEIFEGINFTPEEKKALTDLKDIAKTHAPKATNTANTDKGDADITYDENDYNSTSMRTFASNS